MRLALFTLPLCLLPAGMTQLRVFEPRYHRLVSESFKSGQGFALCMRGDKDAPLPVATRVDIVDFETLDDGMLGITLIGKERIGIGAWQADADGLLHADILTLPQWPAIGVTGKHQEMASTLDLLLNQYPTQLAWYSQGDFDNLSWVCSRWLELLPIAIGHKQRCYQQPDAELTLALLEEIFQYRRSNMSLDANTTPRS